MINYTEHNKLAMPDLNSPADIRSISEVINNIDDELSKFYVATSNTKNLYNIITGINKTELKNGYSIKVGIPSDSDNNVTVSVDNIVVPVKKPNGNPVKNFKANGVYRLTYYNGNFILASGGVDDVNFSTSDLLENKTANNSDGEKVNGTMKNNGAVSINISVNGSYTIPAGYHNGQGKVTQSITTRGAITDSVSNIVSGDSLYTRMPQGAYFTNASSGYPEIRTAVATMSAALGFNANNVVGNVGGINGAVKEYVFREIESREMRGAKFDVDFTPTIAIRIYTERTKPSTTGFCIVFPDGSKMVEYEWNNGPVQPVYLQGNRVYLDTYANENLSANTCTSTSSKIFLVGYK